MTTPHADSSFADLIDETYSLWDKPLPPNVDFEGTEPIQLDIEVDKTRILLSHLPADDPEHFTLYATLGALPSPAAPAMRRALEMNALGSQTQGGVMAINPHSDEMIMVVRVAVEGVDPAALVASMALLSQQAARWKKTHFLEDDALAKMSAPANNKRKAG